MNKNKTTGIIFISYIAIVSIAVLLQFCQQALAGASPLGGEYPYVIVGNATKIDYFYPKTNATDEWYIREVQVRVNGEWEPKKYLKHGLPENIRHLDLGDEKIISSRASFNILPNGDVEAIRLINSSNSIYYDSSCIKAIKDAAPYKPNSRLTIMSYNCNLSINNKDFYDLIAKYQEEQEESKPSQNT